MGRPNPGVCWPVGCTRDANCAGLSADSGTPRVCAPYKTTTVTTTDTVTSCTTDSQCTSGTCNTTTNNPNSLFGPNGKCRAVSWALECAPSLGGSKLGAGAACTTSDQCKTGHCLTPGGYCFGGCTTTADCLNGTTCKSATYLGMTVNFCQP